MSKYKIKFKDGQEIIDQTLDQVIEFKIDNISEKGLFEIIEQIEIKKAKTKNDEKGKSIFMSTLTDQQRSDIKNGFRKVRYSEEGEFWFLQVIDKDEIHISQSQIESKRKHEIQKAFLKSVKKFERGVMIDLLESDLEITEEEVKNLFSCLTLFVKDVKK